MYSLRSKIVFYINFPFPHNFGNGFNLFYFNVSINLKSSPKLRNLFETHTRNQNKFSLKQACEREGFWMSFVPSFPFPYFMLRPTQYRRDEYDLS